MKKRTLCGGLLLLICCGSVITYANNDNSPIGFSVNATNFNATTAPRLKENPSPLYGYITYLQHNSTVQVRAVGVAGSNEEPLTENGLTGNLVPYVTCRQGYQYLIHSQIYEKGYGYAKLGFRSVNIINSEYVSGWWSPDSVGNYIDACQ